MNGRILTIVVIAGLLSLSFSPIISSAEENLQNVLVEMDGEEFSVELSEADCRHVDEVFSRLQQQLNQPLTKSQVKMYVHEALEELDTLGLLGKENVADIERYIMRNVQLPIGEETILDYDSRLDDSYINATCSLLVGGLLHSDNIITNEFLFFPSWLYLVLLLNYMYEESIDIWVFLGNIISIEILENIINHFFGLITYVLSLSVLLSLILLGDYARINTLLPVHLMNLVTFGGVSDGECYGMLTSIGLRVQSIEGNMKGVVRDPYIRWGSFHPYPGVIGYTGLLIRCSNSTYLLGSGLRTRIIEV